MDESHVSNTRSTACSRAPMSGADGASVPLSVVIPCYNEEAVLHELIKRLTPVLNEHAPDCEIVLINDGSRDKTWPMMVELSLREPRLVCVNLSRNHGHQLALTAGLHVCRGERILIIDADLQDPPELLPKMMAIMDEGSDVVYGKRHKRAGETAFKLLTAKMFYRFIDLMSDTPIPQDTGDFRLMSRRALNVLMSMNERHRFIRGMVSWIGFKQTALLYDRDARFAGETKYPLKKMLKFAKDAITGFSVKPLTFASSLGVFFFGFAVLAVIYAFVSKFWFKTEAGWPSLMSLVAFLGGAQLLVLGVIGEYLGRLYEQAKGRPLFIISEIATSGNVAGLPSYPAGPRALQGAKP